MSDSVKGIFKILIKVPVIIAVSYLIFNIFAFAVCYFKVLGLSYAVMQVAMENNYIPDNELKALTGSDSKINDTSGVEFTQKRYNTGLLDNVTLKCETKRGTNAKSQYGEPITVTVSGKYSWLIPFMNSASWYSQSDTTEVVGEGGSGESTEIDSTSASASSTAWSMGEQGKTTKQKNNIEITYKVPGLKYYPDLN
jgi:hypothetical protein